MNDRNLTRITTVLLMAAAAAAGWVSTALVSGTGVYGWGFILACGAFMLGIASHQLIVRGSWKSTLLCLAAFGAAVGAAHREGISRRVRPAMQPPTPTLVEVESVGTQPFTVRLSYTGVVEAARSATLAFAGAGSIVQLAAEENEKVERGRTLAELDVSRLEAQLAEAEAAAAQAGANRRRFEQLFSQGGTSEQLRDDAVTSAVMAESQVKALRALLNDMSLKAPFSGRIGTRHVELGEYASPGKPVYTLLELDPVTVTVGVPEAMIDSVKTGAAALLEIAALPDGEPIAGRVSRIGLQTQPGSPLYPVEVTVPNPAERLRPGMVASVDIEIRRHAAATVLEIPWVHRRRGRHFVFQFVPLEEVRRAVMAAHGIDDEQLESIVALAAEPSDVGVARRVDLERFTIHGSAYVLLEPLPDRPLIVRGGHLLENLSLVRTGVLERSETFLNGGGNAR